MAAGADERQTNDSEVRLVQNGFSAAKIHVLGLAPLKKLLGPRWPRLSGLVHKLFESALRDAQGPADVSIPLDELSYAVTFQNLSVYDTNLVCVAIAKKVCEVLFGDRVDEISVRSVVAAIGTPKPDDAGSAARLIEKTVEMNGLESVVTKSVHSGSVEPVISLSGDVRRCSPQAREQLVDAHSLLWSLGLHMGFFPVWDLQKRSANTLMLQPFSGDAQHIVTSGLRSLAGLKDEQVCEVEIVLLNAIAAYAGRVHDDQKICALTIGVSYTTLSVFHSRIRYLTALQKIARFPSIPILIKIEQIPHGTPSTRIAGLAAMLKLPGVRVLAEYQTIYSVPEREEFLGVIGIGIAMPANAAHETSTWIAEKLVRSALVQKTFAFVDHLDLADFAEGASRSKVRFGTGAALSVRPLSGLEEVPSFPLALADLPRGNLAEGHAPRCEA